MYVFGITGGTGVGKSTVSDEFRKRGVFVSDCDKIAREVVKKSGYCLEELCEVFGHDILNCDGTLNRQKLGNIVFSDKNKLSLLNDITHKYILKKVIEEIKSSKAEICGVDGAVIIGSPVEKICKDIVTVTAKKDVRQKRIMMRDNISYDAAEKRINSQMGEAEYIAHSQYIIENNGDLNKLGEQIEQIYSKIKDKCKSSEKKTSS